MTTTMAKPKPVGKKYDSFYDKALDYHNRMLLWTLSHPKTDSGRQYDQEYNTLTTARSRIREKIEEQLNNAFFFLSVIPLATFPDVEKRIKKQQFNETPLTDEFKKIGDSLTLPNYLLNLNKNDEIRNEIEYQNKDFVSEIFSEERMKKIFELIFYPYYKGKLTESEEEYRLDMALLMMKESTRYIFNHYLLYPETQFLAQEFTKAEQIGHLIKTLSTGRNPLH